MSASTRPHNGRARGAAGGGIPRTPPRPLRAAAVLLAVLLLLSLASCASPAPGAAETGTRARPSGSAPPADTAAPAPAEPVDFASSLKLDMESETRKQEATVRTFVDGDTTHFHVPASVDESGVLRARYLAVDTPESSGRVEPWGRCAAAFTRERLSGASSILLESDDDQWNRDSTSSRRTLVWVWYKPSAAAEYRNLNVELLQEGLAIAYKSASNRYGDVCVAAIAQAKRQELRVYSDERDPDFFYGDAIELTLKGLRCRLPDYDGKKVAFEGVVTKNSNNSVYIEDADPETGLLCGMTVYYGYGLNGDALDILSIGNRIRVVGTVQYYEAGGTYQVSGLTYRVMRPDDPDNLRKISGGHEPAYVLTTPDRFRNGKVAVSAGAEESDRSVDYADFTLHTSIRMEGLRVVRAYTTERDGSASDGAMTLTCEAEDGTEIRVRTVVLRDEAGRVVTQDAFIGKILDVKGIVDTFDGEPQIKVFSLKDLSIKNP